MLCYIDDLPPINVIIQHFIFLLSIDAVVTLYSIIFFLNITFFTDMCMESKGGGDM